MRLRALGATTLVTAAALLLAACAPADIVEPKTTVQASAPPVDRVAAPTPPADPKPAEVFAAHGSRCDRGHGRPKEATCAVDQDREHRRRAAADQLGVRRRRVRGERRVRHLAPDRAVPEQLSQVGWPHSVHAAHGPQHHWAVWRAADLLRSAATVHQCGGRLWHQSDRSRRGLVRLLPHQRQATAAQLARLPRRLPEAGEGCRRTPRAVGVRLSGVAGVGHGGGQAGDHDRPAILALRAPALEVELVKAVVVPVRGQRSAQDRERQAANGHEHRDPVRDRAADRQDQSGHVRARDAGCGQEGQGLRGHRGKVHPGDVVKGEPVQAVRDRGCRRRCGGPGAGSDVVRAGAHEWRVLHQGELQLTRGPRTRTGTWSNPGPCARGTRRAPLAPPPSCRRAAWPHPRTPAGPPNRHLPG